MRIRIYPYQWWSEAAGWTPIPSSTRHITSPLSLLHPSSSFSAIPPHVAFRPSLPAGAGQAAAAFYRWTRRRRTPRRGADGGRRGLPSTWSPSSSRSRPSRDDRRSRSSTSSLPTSRPPFSAWQVMAPLSPQPTTWTWNTRDQDRLWCRHHGWSSVTDLRRGAPAPLRLRRQWRRKEEKEKEEEKEGRGRKKRRKEE